MKIVEAFYRIATAHRSAHTHPSMFIASRAHSSGLSSNNNAYFICVCFFSICFGICCVRASFHDHELTMTSHLKWLLVKRRGGEHVFVNMIIFGAHTRCVCLCDRCASRCCRLLPSLSHSRQSKIRSCINRADYGRPRNEPNAIVAFVTEIYIFIHFVACSFFFRRLRLLSLLHRYFKAVATDGDVVRRVAFEESKVWENTLGEKESQLCVCVCDERWAKKTESHFTNGQIK